MMKFKRGCGAVALVAASLAAWPGAGGGAVLGAVPAAAQSGGDPVAYSSALDVRPTFMGTVYDFRGGELDGQRGWLFRVWNRTGEPVRLDGLPGATRPGADAVLSVGAVYEGTGESAFRDDPGRWEFLFADGAEVLEPSPSGAFGDRPANIVIVTEADVERVVYTLGRRTATASLSAANVEEVELDGGAELDLPPHPGREGRATLQGIDSNGNGVRDDVEIAIAKTYSDPAVRALQMQGARGYARTLEIGASGSTYQTYAAQRYVNTKEAQIYSACLVYEEIANHEYAWSEDRGRELRAMMLNTRERIRAYDSFDDALGNKGGGTVIRNANITEEDCASVISGDFAGVDQ